MLGVVVSGLAIGGVLYLLNAAWGYGTAEIPAPQAQLMKMMLRNHGRNFHGDLYCRCIPCNLP